MKVDLEKRRKVMERSRRLGHCICEPRRPCPCDIFRNKGICPCAGERPESANIADIKLTQLVHNAGCASKIAPADLERVLGRLPEVKDPLVISGLAAADDAAIYQISDNLCLVQTVDVFTPCVDDPHLFGRICAANCLSDIYAMGGDPRTALSILAFPSETLDGEIMYQMLAGAMETLGQAGVALVGGHSIKDEEIKLGFAITGSIDPSVASSLDSPQVGDVLVLTKPLGTGVLSFARQIGRNYPVGFAQAETSMATLNKVAAEAMRQAGASACTDITGFGLCGHLVRMVRQKNLTAELFADALPAFDSALEALRDGIIPGAIERNREFVGSQLRAFEGIDEASLHLGFDAQTSGGLLIAIAPAKLEILRQALLQKGIPSFVIGRFIGQTSSCESHCKIHVVKQTIPVNSQTQQQVIEPPMNANSPAPSAGAPALLPASHVTGTNIDKHQPGCCSDIFPPTPATSTSAESKKAFGAMMRAVQAGGALNEKTKELILFSLILQSRCEPCFEAHHRKALDMGITPEELEEAAWCAIAMGGAPVRMFYQECLEKAQSSKQP